MWEDNGAPAEVAVRGGRLTWTSRPPVVLRRTGSRRVHTVQVGGGPLGGDHLALSLDVGRGERLAVHSAAATVVQPGREPGSPASFTVDAHVGRGAVLDWSPEPTVVTDRADWTVSLRVALAPGACLRLREQLVLGRHGQRGGRVRSDVDVRRVGGVSCSGERLEGRLRDDGDGSSDGDGVPLLVTSTRVDGTLDGPGGLGGARSVGTLLLVGGDGGGTSGEERDVRWAWTSLEAGGALLTAVGSVAAVGRVLDRAGEA